MKLNIHSIIDVITNSSTEIYTSVDNSSINGAHAMINEILKVAGSEFKSKDLFDIQIIKEDSLECEVSSLEIKSKDITKSDKDIWKLFFNLFYQEAQYNS
jgi:hypothetical protein